ncbi:alpha/beta hydrolase [Caulobacter sp. 17J65-9]|uniref:alpha/beta hydrolase n=1 Tax=Caulobacter sp. 17J65-9 TaxID=2709382 RepID=UPI0013CC37D6|nr:alpha/beta hydrolase [Caulobacter sp. 17J65-9]NEX92166.1 alpha/beta hydrolase [Caulobacter sp. 17J65-9]
MADPAIQRLYLKSVLSLPPPVLRALSGGGVIWRGGRTLDPRFQFLWKAWRKPRGIASVTPEEARTTWAEMVETAAPRAPSMVRVDTVMIDGPASTLTARLYRPSTLDPAAPVLVFFHDGAGVVGDLETSHALCARLAEYGQCLVLAPAYRLAPEHRFPAGFDDAFAAYAWALENAERLGGPPGVAAVGGQSIGAGFAAGICAALKAERQPQPVLQLLICPLVDIADESQSMQTYADAWPLSAQALKWVLGWYLSADADPNDPRLSPLRADVAGFAPALIVTAGFDPLADQGESYARKLKSKGVPVIYRCYDGLPHAFPEFAGLVPCAEVACTEIAGFLREGLEGRLVRAAALPDHQDSMSLVI